MGWFKLVLNAGNAEGCREAMRMSYRKHLSLALQGSVVNSNNPHWSGLYGALGTRYEGQGIPTSFPKGQAVWAELSPFLLMEETDAIEALAEYIVYKERRLETKTSWLRKLINDAFRTPSTIEDPQRILASAAILEQVAWCNLLDQDIKSALENEIRDNIEKISNVMKSGTLKA